MSSQLPATAEIVIVGGGAMGCSLAYYLAARGITSVLLERTSLGSGSTGRCAGGVRQQFSTEVNVRLGRRSIEILATLHEELGFDPLYRPIGYLLLATSEARAETLKSQALLQQRLGIDTQLLDCPAVTLLVPGIETRDVVAATFCGSDGLAGPSEVTLGYAAAARRLGARIFEDADVTEIQSHHGKVIAVEATVGTVATETVVICAGPQARSVGRLAGVQLPGDPVRRHIWLTSSFARQPENTPMTVDLESTFYFHPEGDGLMIGMGDPADAVGEYLTVDWATLPRLVEEGSRRLPALAQASVVTGWAGLYEMTPDKQPLVGPAIGLDGLWLACGFSGHGFMMAPSVGESLARLIAGDPPVVDLSAFSMSRFTDGVPTPELAVI